MRAKRLGRGLTQLAVSQILGVDECTVTNWEKNHSKPMLHLLPKVIEFLGYNPMTNERKTLGEKLLQYRKSCGITQKELAKQIGIDPTTLSRVERKIGKYLPPTAEKMSKFLAESTCIQ